MIGTCMNKCVLAMLIKRGLRQTFPSCVTLLLSPLWNNGLSRLYLVQDVDWPLLQVSDKSISSTSARTTPIQKKDRPAATATSNKLIELWCVLWKHQWAKPSDTHCMKEKWNDRSGTTAWMQNIKPVALTCITLNETL